MEDFLDFGVPDKVASGGPDKVAILKFSDFVTRSRVPDKVAFGPDKVASGPDKVHPAEAPHGRQELHGRPELAPLCHRQRSLGMLHPVPERHGEKPPFPPAPWAGPAATYLARRCTATVQIKWHLPTR